jgi:tetratricopeptide (TPR) repeat protein
VNTTIGVILAGALLAPAQATAGPQSPANAPEQSARSVPDSARADAYYYFTLGHLQEQQYEAMSSSELAEQAVASYKKALELEPDSAVVHERLAEVYAKSQHIRDAVTEAQEALRIDANNVSAHRLLARIYVRTLGDLGAGEVQQENLKKAVEQFQAILKVEPKDVYSALWLARLYRFENRHEDAEKVLRSVVVRDPENAPALEQLSQLLMDEGRSKEAIDLLTRSASDSSSPETYDLLGDAYSQSKDFAQAEAAYRKAIDGDPDDPGHRHGLAEALMAQNKLAEALEQYQRLTEIEPGTAENYVRMAQLQRRLGQFDQAESSLARAKQLAPGSLEILYNEALLYQDEGRYDDAVKVLTDAIAGTKSQGGGTGSPSALAILYEQLGRAFGLQQKYAAAIDTYAEMAKLGPDSQRRAELLLINAYRDSRDLDRAIAEAKKALATYPKDSDFIVTLAMLYGEKADTATATQLLQGILKGDDSDQQIYIDIAQVQQRGKKYTEAEQSGEKAEQLARDPESKKSTWFMLGAIYEREKKYDLAEQQFRKVIDADPNNAPALNYLGYMLADRGVRLEEATALINRAVKQEPNNGAYLDSLGWVYYKQNKLAEAEEYMRKAVDREGHDPTILSHLGDVYLKLGQTERAAELFERSLAEWQRALPADFEAGRVSEVEARLKTVKRRLAQKSSPETAKPQ